MDILSIALWAFLTLWAVILVHEAGHYLTGLAVGVPARVMAIRLERPPHVALHDGDSWRSPGDAGYNEVFRRHAPSASAAWLYVAGGFIAETFAVLLIACSFRGAGDISFVILIVSTLLFMVYIVGDCALSARTQQPYGDVGALWAIQPVITVLFLLMVLAIRAVAIVFL